MTTRNDNLPVPVDPVDIERVINSWLLRPASGATNQTYAAAFRRIKVATWDIPRVDNDTAMLIIKRLYATGFSDNTVRTTVKAMSSLWTKLAKAGLVKDNPWKDQKVREPKDKTPERVLSPAELDALLYAADTHNVRHGLYIRYLYYSAFRVEESTLVTWGELRPDSDECIEQLWREPDQEEDRKYWFYVTVGGEQTKGNKTRTVKIPMRLVREMMRWYGPDNIEPDKRVWDFGTSWAWDIVHGAAKRAGLGKNVSPHWLRHTAATDALDAGASLRVVQESLGHASPVTTAKYTHVRPTDRTGGYVREV